MKRRDRDSPPPSVAANPYREDCWTDGETSALIDVWGDLYLELNRGNIGHKDWEDMAAAVNSCRRGDHHRPPRTGLQCKNRVGTLKKRYKAEKASAYGSRWPFYSRLDALIGSSAAAAAAGKPSASPPTAVPLIDPRRRKAADLFTSASQKHYLMAAAAAEEEGSSDSSAWSRPPKKRRTARRGDDGEDGKEETRMLAKAIVEFTDVYERVERSKMRREVELQKQRMEFDTKLELEWMKMFADFIIQSEKKKIKSNR